MDLTKILKTIAAINFALAVLVCLGFFITWIDEDAFLIFTYVETVITAAITILFAIVGFASNPKNAKSVLIGIGAMVVLVLLSWVFASDAIPQFIGWEKYNITAGSSKFVGTSLYAIYILTILAVLAMIGSEIYRVIIKR